MNATAESLLQAVFPSLCACCGQVLVQGERMVCLECMTQCTRTQYGLRADNPVERMLAPRLPLVHATALLHFQQGGAVQQLVHAMKFTPASELCIAMGRQLGLDLMRSGRFDDVELLVPVPLHWLRRLARGYNQSELLCRGIAQVFPRPVLTGALVRHRYTRQQSLRHASERDRNVAGAFKVRHSERLAGRHILLVDDVLTTGATLASCCQPLGNVDGVRISVATLSVAGK